MKERILPPPYRVIRPLGHGGIGEIYLTYHENLEKQVVVKKVKDHCRDVVDSRIEVDILKITYSSTNAESERMDLNH